MSKIGLINYGSGNIQSVFNSLESLGADVRIIDRPEAAEDVGKLVLPGVGSFRYASAVMRENGFFDFLNEQVKVRGKPILGICIGMQIMAREGIEGGRSPGLGWFDAEVSGLRELASDLRIPHVGWNNVSFARPHPLAEGLGPDPDFYFVHSYHFVPSPKEDCTLATVSYGKPIVAAIGGENVYGTQFHPEKSQALGLRLLENFLRI